MRNFSRHILVTGSAGFIGFHLCKKLIKENFNVIGIDNLNRYYDLELKNSRINILKKNNPSEETFKFIKVNLNDFENLRKLFKNYHIDVVVNLAAQAGVRYSLKNPLTYIDSNLVGFSHLLECCREFSIKNLIYASSSSVYGGNQNIPFSERDHTSHPLSIYAATKKANELMAHSYSHLYNIPSTGVRLFTVYGPWGRPDMAPMIFTKAILENKPIKIFNQGDMWRDFTYIDDVVENLFRLISLPAKGNASINKELLDPSYSWAPYQIFNLGNSQPINLLSFIEILEKTIGKKAIKEFHDMQPGDVSRTEANNFAIEKYTGYKPKTNIEIGIKKFVKWYLSYYSNK